jgi:subtilisin family serine protease
MSPASAPSVIAVGSSTNEDKISSFSNIGKCLTLFAPGSQIISTSYKSDSGSVTMSGTSMAAPHVSGPATGWGDIA